MRKFSIIAAGTFVSLAVASNAFAADCDSDVVLVRGSSASQKLIEAVAKVAAGQGVKIAYSNSGSSCVGPVTLSAWPLTKVLSKYGSAA